MRLGFFSAVALALIANLLPGWVGKRRLERRAQSAAQPGPR
jgi:hypothetical protein